MASAASRSASSGVCLNLKESRAPGPGAAAPFAGLATAAAGNGFFAEGAAAGDDAVSPAADDVPFGAFLAYMTCKVSFDILTNQKQACAIPLIWQEAS